MESNEISLHQAKIFSFMQAHKLTWHTVKDVQAATAVSPRATHNNLLRLVKLGLLDQAELYPGHRYRFSEKAAQRNLAYLQRLETACSIFEL